MKVAAKEFVDLMLTGSSASDTTINLIPFAGQVNPGAYVMGKMTPARVHGYSSCIDADTTELLGGDLTNMGTARQTPHFQYFRFEADYGHNAEWGWCPSDTQAIEYMSNNASRLKDRIEDFVAHDGTGIPIAMSWALGLLRPNAQPLIADLADQNMVEDRFANRPLPMGGNDTMKVIVLMSDGRTTQQMRPMAWAYDEQHEIEDLAENYMSNAEEMISVADARTHLDALCNSAKGQKVVVFTVGFDLSGTDYALDDLRDCASGIGHFYNVNGVELSEAFEAIATTITKLRLVY